MLRVRGCIPKLLRDIEERKETEIDYINGYLLKESLRYRVNTPFNESIYLLVKSIEHSMRM